MKPRVFKEDGEWHAECCGGRWFTIRRYRTWEKTLNLARWHFDLHHRRDSEVPS